MAANLELFRTWARGVVTTLQGDDISEDSSPRGRNAALLFAGGSIGIPVKRRGAELVNVTPLTGNPATLGIYNFKRRVGAAVDRFRLIVADDGSLNDLDVGAGTISVIDATAFTPGDFPPNFETANNLAFITNGQESQKTDGTTVFNFGITRPGAPVVVAGAAGVMSGTYRIAISYFNNNTGHESSRSAFTSIVLAAQRANISWSAPVDPQVTHIFVHILKEGTMTEFFKISSGFVPAPDSTGGFPVPTVATVLNATDATLTALSGLSPDTAENDPPPAGIQSLAWHLSRLFTHDKQNIYYSKPGKPESFDPDAFEAVNPNDRQDIIKIIVAFGRLLVFKSDSIHELRGVDPDTWVIEPIDSSIGCVAKDSLVFYKDTLFWWSRFGPCKWAGSGEIEQIGINYLQPTVEPDMLNFTRVSRITGAVDGPRQRVLFSFTENGENRNTAMLPWNNLINAWESDKWQLFDVSAMGVLDDANERPFVYLGNYSGRLFKLWAQDTDGARLDNGAGTQFTLNSNVGSATSTTLTDLTATFDTTATGLADLYLYVVSQDGFIQRRRITSNTATVITVSTPFESIPQAPSGDVVWTYHIGAAQFEWDTKWADAEIPFNRKRYIHLFVQAFGSSGTATVFADVFLDRDDQNAVRTYNFDVVGLGAIFNEANFNEAVFGAAGYSNVRKRVAKVGRIYRVRIRNVESNKQLALLKVGMQFIPLTWKN